MNRWQFACLFAVSLALVGWGWHLAGAQQPSAKPAKPADPDRFEFEVIESFDGKYDGDTPGHIGKYGGLDQRRPRVALHDPVYMGDNQIGIVTGVRWSRAYGSLEVEFTTDEKVRVCVGDLVWIAMHDKAEPKKIP
ncbi:MAG: hypothetical protein SFU86_25300 [Pirellulaceae bacterium]|nr:hypothetical protein [Pirellulaceae bacterium]